MSARLLVFGLDAGDPAVVRSLAASGRMPAMAKLLAAGAQYPMIEPRGHSFIAERWTTMVTGVGPEIHRYYCWAEYDKTSGVHRPAPLDPMKIPRLWDRLSEAGKKVAVIDVPRQPLSKVNGIQLCEWAAHDRDLGASSWPPHLADDLNVQFGEHALSCATKTLRGQFAPCDVVLKTGSQPRSQKELSELSALIHQSLNTKISVSEHILASGTWDLFFTVIGETHCATHQFWHLHKPLCESDRVQAAALGDVVVQTFERADETLARHMAMAGSDAVVVVVLHSGMAPPSGGNELLGELLARLDSPFIASAFTNRIGALRFRAPRGWFRSKLAIERLRSQLEKIMDDETGRPAIHALKSRANYFPGIDDDSLPDLFVEWNGDTLIKRLSGPAIGTIVRLETETARTADHTPDGLIVIAGPEIKPGIHLPIDPAEFASKVTNLLGTWFDPSIPPRT